MLNEKDIGKLSYVSYNLTKKDISVTGCLTLCEHPLCFSLSLTVYHKVCRHVSVGC